MADIQRSINPLLELCHTRRLLQLLQYRIKRYVLTVTAVSGPTGIDFETIPIILKQYDCHSVGYMTFNFNVSATSHLKTIRAMERTCARNGKQ